MNFHTVNMKNLFQIFKKKWLWFARKVGQVNTAILLAVVYLFVIGLMALIVKILGKDLLQKRINSKLKSYWIDRNESEQTLERHKYQF
jgi:hypothetical protein